MAEKDIKKALGSSLRAEAKRVEERFSPTKKNTRNTARPTSAAGPGPTRSGKSKKTKKKSPPAAEAKIRDRFNLAESDYARIGSLKQKCREAGLPSKKSMLIGAALRLLDGLSLQRLEKLLTPASSGKDAAHPKKRRRP